MTANVTASWLSALTVSEASTLTFLRLKNWAITIYKGMPCMYLNLPRLASLNGLSVICLMFNIGSKDFSTDFSSKKVLAVSSSGRDYTNKISSQKCKF